uniref:Uncharacterized protein n=1 Tax=Anguilla anguilla TaxID=7936 RepID=A0A0E9UPH7_ANGAN
MQLKCTKARNDYLLSLAAANASTDKYYLQDICTIIDVSIFASGLFLLLPIRASLRKY